MEAERQEYVQVNAQLAQQKTISQNLQEKLTAQRQELEQLQEKFSKEFENLANRILEREESEIYRAKQKSAMDVILNPLKEKIKDF